ncbi:elongation factor P 5-aminopentanone reductase [Herbinix luporum]|uniref:elongation factor P 5-aminopentanone reductase n=1 Tax=Herbinix luporum TaxID=1679721 RepID=UPI0023F031BB|nr:SDR family oxidoreductase [Herbinix luporum]
MSAINIGNRKTVLITGSSKGIGKAIALRFAKEGYNLVINGSKDKEKLEETKAEIEKFNVYCLAFLGDMGDYHKVKELFKLIKEEFGHLDVLVNNAGISYVGLLSDMTWQDWDKVIRTNLTSIYNCCSLAIPDMVQKKEGKIINISSVWGNVGASCEVAYSASKGGMNAFTKALAKELAPSNIKVNAIACGAIDTEMNSFLSEEELYQLKEEIPMGRLGRSDEVADLVYYLAEKNEYLTGQVIGLDGGWI